MRYEHRHAVYVPAAVSSFFFFFFFQLRQGAFWQILSVRENSHQTRMKSGRSDEFRRGIHVGYVRHGQAFAFRPLLQLGNFRPRFARISRNRRKRSRPLPKTSRSDREFPPKRLEMRPAPRLAGREKARHGWTVPVSGFETRPAHPCIVASRTGLPSVRW